MMYWRNFCFLLSTVFLVGSFTSCQTEKVADKNNSSSEPALRESTDLPPLPERAGPRTRTTGKVPHVQVGVEPPEQGVLDELIRRAFALPDVENRPSAISLPGAKGMWLSENVELARADVIVAGREFAHIHPDGSLHASLPYDRAIEAVNRGWAERHPWADERHGWEGFVMLFTPNSMEEVDVTFQLIVDSYNHVTGRSVEASDYRTNEIQVPNGQSENKKSSRSTNPKSEADKQALIDLMEELVKEQQSDSKQDAIGSRVESPIHLHENTIRLNGKSISNPCDVKDFYAVLGKPDRVEEKANTIHVWDSEGLVCYCHPRKSEVHCFEIVFDRSVLADISHTPEKSFSGKVKSEEAEFSLATTREQLKSIGFERGSEEFFYSKKIGDQTTIVIVFNETGKLYEVSLNYK